MALYPVFCFLTNFGRWNQKTVGLMGVSRRSFTRPECQVLAWSREGLIKEGSRGETDTGGQRNTKSLCAQEKGSAHLWPSSASKERCLDLFW